MPSEISHTFTTTVTNDDGTQTTETTKLCHQNPIAIPSDNPFRTTGGDTAPGFRDIAIGAYLLIVGLGQVVAHLNVPARPQK
jgi:hypothetical protein